MGDTIASKKSLSKYSSEVYNFNNSRESELLNGIIQSLEENDMIKFEEDVRKYDKIS